MTHLLLTVRFLDDRYHGLLGRGGPPEWPPSPFRLFQSLVAGVARRGGLVNGNDIPSNKNFTPIGQALGWMQRHTREHPPIIIAPKSKTGQAIVRFVPNNDGDKKFDRQERLTAKPTIPTLFLLEPEQKPEVHYLWDISGVSSCPEKEIRDAARALTTLGWGIDMAFADARVASVADLEKLKGVRWYPKRNAGSLSDTLRMPTFYKDECIEECTLCDLRHCHSTFITRIEHGKPLKTVDKPKIFDRVLYTSIERPIGRRNVVFKLLDPNEDRARYPHAKLIHVAGMVRHVAIERMKKDPWRRGDPKWLESFVCGHRGGAEIHQQISYVPLPSIGHDHADAMIRNVMLVAPLGCERELEWVAERINGEELKPENQVRSIGTENSGPIPGLMRLDRFTPPKGKFIDTRYLGTSQFWQTVTPVILPGHDDHKPAKTIKLIQKALAQSGIEQSCTIDDWRAVPYLKNCLSAYKYDRDKHRTGYYRPDHLMDLTTVHLRLRFESSYAGPLVLGAGRHCGFGLLATAD